MGSSFLYDQSNSVNQVRVWVNLQTGALGTVQASAPATNAAARITAYPNGFYRVSISGILSTATAVLRQLLLQQRMQQQRGKIMRHMKYGVPV